MSSDANLQRGSISDAYGHVNENGSATNRYVKKDARQVRFVQDGFLL
ncbi:MAG TPA: hypothetical protein VFD70_28850 [Anaerolineae bacterium]|nr:hypothetical protein [Anaerolineae bacterium]